MAVGCRVVRGVFGPTFLDVVFGVTARLLLVVTGDEGAGPSSGEKVERILPWAVVDSVFGCSFWAGDLRFSGGAVWRWL